MKKIETIWHYILHEALTNHRVQHTQQEIARTLGYSLSTVNHALAVPTANGSIRKAGKYFLLADGKKLLYYWASVRSFEADIIYQTTMNQPITELEGLVPPQSIYACYSAARQILMEPPADYDKLYVYLPSIDLATFQNRFPPTKKSTHTNVIVLTQAHNMERYGTSTTLTQTFVDIWNLRDWYAKEFVLALEKKINELLS